MTLYQQPAGDCHIRDAIPLGMNGAALAALGDMVAVFFPALDPLRGVPDGVKLGESTLNRFLLLLDTANSHRIPERGSISSEKKNSKNYLSACGAFPLSLWGSWLKAQPRIPFIRLFT